MRYKFLSFSNLTLLVALCLSSVAAWYSIIGLTAIFAGAVIPVIIMGGILEVGKITTTVWLRKYWNRCGLLLKLYLVPAVIALALLTSMGIFGFLSKAHMEHGISTGDSQAKLSLYDEKIKTQRDNIELARKALTQMDNQVDQRLSRGDSENSAERAVQIRRQQSGERTKLQKEIGDAQKEIAKLNEERAPIAAENRKIEAEVGPIKYIAALIYGENTDNNTLEAAVRWVIILLVIVFDPLAIALVLAANASKEWDDEEPDPKSTKESAYEPDDGPLTDKQLEQVKETAKEDLPDSELITKSELFPDESIECNKCGTTLIDAPGIGLFCPNKQCDVIDNTKGVAWTFIPPEPIAQPEKTLAELHPYLNKPFDHFKNLEPMVYKPEVTEKQVKPKKKRVKKEVKTIVEPEPAESLERPGDYITPSEDTHSMVVKQDLPFKELPGGYVAYQGKHMQKEAFLSMNPQFLKIAADSGKQVNSSFGPKFPDSSEKGDVFTRVDVLPNKVYKFDGQNWIEISKNSSNTYLYNTKYIEYLVDMIGNGQYDPELLLDNERSQIEDYLKLKKTTDQKS
jgi:hypothetical protein